MFGKPLKRIGRFSCETLKKVSGRIGEFFSDEELKADTLKATAKSYLMIFLMFAVMGVPMLGPFVYCHYKSEVALAVTEPATGVIISPGVVQAPIYRRDGIGMLQPVLVPAVIVRCDDQRDCIIPCFIKPDGCKLENGEHVSIVRRKASDWIDQGRLQEARFAPLPEKPI